MGYFVSSIQLLSRLTAMRMAVLIFLLSIIGVRRGHWCRASRPVRKFLQDHNLPPSESKRRLCVNHSDY